MTCMQLSVLGWLGVGLNTSQFCSCLVRHSHMLNNHFLAKVGKRELDLLACLLQGTVWKVTGTDCFHHRYFSLYGVYLRFTILLMGSARGGKSTSTSFWRPTRARQAVINTKNTKSSTESGTLHLMSACKEHMAQFTRKQTNIISIWTYETWANKFWRIHNSYVWLPS